MCRLHSAGMRSARASGARRGFRRAWHVGNTGLMGGTSVPAPPAREDGPRGGSAPERLLIRVLLAEDVAGVRDTLVALLGLEPDIEVCAALAAGDEVVPAALAHRPDVAVLDIGLPGISGLAATAELARQLPACRVLILTGLDARENLDTALQAGARGFLLKESPADELIAAVRAVARGEQVIDVRLASGSPGQGDGPGPAR
jgi:two-component system, NarL family, response regulator DesR